MIPAASVRGGFGGGEGEGSEDTPAGRGGGMTVSPQARSVPIRSRVIESPGSPPST